jgi:glycogen operon protein
MTDADWRNPASRAVALLVDGCAQPDRDADGVPMLDEDLLVLANGWWEPLPFTLPPQPGPHAGAVPSWRMELDTFTGTVWPVEAELYPPGDVLTVGPRSLVLLVAPRPRAGV